MSKSNRYLLLLIVYLSVFTTLKSQDANLYKYSIGDFVFIYYGKQYSYLIPHTARSFTNAFNFHRKTFQYDPGKPIPVFVNDLSDFGSGGALAIPFNFVTLGINPFDNVYENMPASERMQWLASHELTHITMADKPGAQEEFFRSIFFGKPLNDNNNPMSMLYSYLASPRWYCPRWYHEGIAIFMETFMNGGAGRLLGGYDEMVFRTMFLDSSYFYEPIGLEIEGTTADFMVGANAYLYGTRFVSYLAAKHGKDKLLDFFTRSSSSNMFFASQFKKVYHISLLDEWHNWIDDEKIFQQKNIDKIKSFKLTNHRKVLSNPLGSASRQFYDRKRNSIICAVSYPGKLAHIAEIDIHNGNMREIAPIMSPRLFFVTNIAYDESSGTVFITENNSHFRDLVMLDIGTGKIIKKLKFERLGDLAFNKADKTLWGMRNYNGRSMISRLHHPYNNVEELVSIPFGYNFFDLDISPDGKLLSGVYSDPNGRQKIVVYKINDLLQGKNEFEEIYEFEDNTSSNFTFSLDGKWLYGTSYITGVSNIFRINIETKELDILTNTERGYFRPVQISPDSMLAYSYSSKGFTPVLIEIDTCSADAINLFGMRVLDKNPELQSWTLPPISSINLDSIGYKEEKYSALENTRLSYIIPIIEGYKDFPSYGIKTRFFDKLFISGLDLTMSYSPNPLIPESERLHLLMKYHYWFWELTASWNKADFYDLLGPTKRSREGGMLGIKYQDYLLPNRSPEKLNYSVRAGYYFDLKTLPQYQDIRSNANWLVNTQFELKYSILRKSLGAIEEESGYEYAVFLNNNYAENSNFFSVFGNANFGTLLPIRNSSVWFRLYAGKSFADNKASPFNDFYFGGFGNNYLDNNSVQRYREMISFPGTKINHIVANSFAKTTLEWNLPPVRFKKLGLLSAYITYSRLSFFGSAMSSNLQDLDTDHLFFCMGAQLDFEVSLFYLLKTWLSFGYAGSFNKYLKPSDEFMISLKF